MRPGHRFGDTEVGRPPFVSGMVDITPFALDQRIDQAVASI
jgi:hypothetical protein